MGRCVRLTGCPGKQHRKSSSRYASASTFGEDIGVDRAADVALDVLDGKETAQAGRGEDFALLRSRALSSNAGKVDM